MDIRNWTIRFMERRAKNSCDSTRSSADEEKLCDAPQIRNIGVTVGMGGTPIGAGGSYSPLFTPWSQGGGK